MTLEKRATPAVIEQIKKAPGLYLAKAPNGSVAVAPLWVDGQGNIWSMKLDSILSDEGWVDNPEIAGPLTCRSPTI